MGQYHLAMLPADEVAVRLVSAEDLDKVPFSKIFANVKPVKIADANTVQAGYVERRSCVGIVRSGAGGSRPSIIEGRSSAPSQRPTLTRRLTRH